MIPAHRAVQLAAIIDALPTVTGYSASYDPSGDAIIIGTPIALGGMSSLFSVILMPLHLDRDDYLDYAKVAVDRLMQAIDTWMETVDVVGSA